MKRHLTRYFVAMLITTAILMAVALFFYNKMLSLSGQHYNFLPISVGYFAVLTSLIHILLVRSLYKEPRLFIRNFLFITVAYMLVNLFIILLFVFASRDNITAAKYFVLTFLVLYLSYLVLEAVSLSIFVLQRRREEKAKQAEESPVDF